MIGSLKAIWRWARRGHELLRQKCKPSKNLMTKLMDPDSLMELKHGIQTGTKVMVLRGRSGCSFGALT